MKCGDVLPALEVGGWFRRVAARRHVARCPACARALAAWRALKSELAAAPPLTNSERHLWLCAREQCEPAAGSIRVRKGAAFALAAAVLGFVCYWSFQRDPPIGRERLQPIPDLIQATVEPITQESIVAETAPLERGLDRIEAELAKLSHAVALADLKRQTSVLLKEYPHW